MRINEINDNIMRDNIREDNETNNNNKLRITMYNEQDPN